MLFLTLLFALLVGHALADYPLQGDFLAKAKFKDGIPGVPHWIALWNHALIHGGAVALITGSITLGICETALHGVIDDMKCHKAFGFEVDQALHVACKVMWTVLVITAPHTLP